MARLKKKKIPTVGDGRPVLVDPKPLHPRVFEWNGIERGDAVNVSGGRKGSHWTFVAYATPPGADPYVEVLEQQSAGRNVQGPKLMRAIAPERVTAVRKRKVRQVHKPSGPPPVMLDQ